MRRLIAGNWKMHGTPALIDTFLRARFGGAVRHRRRLAKVQALEMVAAR